MTRLIPWWLGTLLAAVMAAPVALEAKSRTSGSTTDARGNTVTYQKNDDGTTTRTITSPDGDVLESGVLKSEPVTTVPPREPGTSASTKDEQGNTVTIKKNPDGTTTRTVTSPDGQELDSDVVHPEPPTAVAPRQPGTSGSTTDADGNTVTYTKNPNGTTTRTVTSPGGQELDSEVVQPEAPTTVPPRVGGDSASTTDADGNTVTISKNPDGTTSRTVVSSDGQVLDRDVLQPEPPTTVPPRTGGDSASTTDADGNTISIIPGEDGIRIRRVISPGGAVLKSEPVASQPAGAQLLYNTAKQGDVSVAAGMVLEPADPLYPGQYLLMVSLLATGRGAEYRTWVVRQAILEIGNAVIKALTSEPYYLTKESLAMGFAPLLFAAIAMQYVQHASRAAASEGTPCSASGGESGDAGHEREKGTTLGREAERIGRAAAMGLLSSQAKGTIEGRKYRFDVTTVVPELTTSGRIVLRVTNTEPSRMNVANQPKDLTFKIPVKFEDPRGLLLTIRPTIIRDTEAE